MMRQRAPRRRAGETRAAAMRATMPGRSSSTIRSIAALSSGVRYLSSSLTGFVISALPD